MGNLMVGFPGEMVLMVAYVIFAKIVLKRTYVFCLTALSYVKTFYSYGLIFNKRF